MNQIDDGLLVRGESCHTPEVDELFDLGWVFVPDRHHPKNKEMGFYVMHLSDAAYGWYVKDDHPVKHVLVGDSRPRWLAAKTVLSAWIGTAVPH